ncbi:MAG: hypothetical protein ACMUJM_07920 [bacterium]
MIKWKNSCVLIFILFSFVLIHHTGAESEFEKWKKQELGDFQEFKDKRDKEFTRYLKRQWKEFTLFAGAKIYEKPKPVRVPRAPSQKAADKEKSFQGTKIEKIPAQAPPKPTPKKEPVGQKIEGRSVTITFFGQSLDIPYDPAMKLTIKGSIDKNNISSFWETLSKASYENTVHAIHTYKNDLQLNDWGYYFLIYKMGEALYGKENANETTLLAWFILSKSGYEARIGYNENKVNLLLPSHTTLYAVPFIKLDGKKYYAISFDETKKQLGALYTYKGSYPEADRVMDTSIQFSPNITHIPSTKNLSFDYQGKRYEIPVTFNAELIEFFRFYPQTNFEVYFQAPVSDEATESLLNGLRPYIGGKSEGEAVNFLLHFVQTAFEYKTDDAQFGREKYMLSEETLYYPFSDCEDRSILFAFLVRKLTGLSVIGLHYPNHLATAVKFTDPLEGDSILANGIRYIICDPTYINADIGMAMPQFKNEKPKVIYFHEST